jgi:hypothetical protein
MLIVLLNIFACKESSTHEHCILIRELGYADPCVSSPSEKKVTALRKEQVRTCNKAALNPAADSTEKHFSSRWTETDQKSGSENPF